MKETPSMPSDPQGPILAQNPKPPTAPPSQGEEADGPESESSVVSALDRLIKPLDQILVHMERYSEGQEKMFAQQRRLFAAVVVAAVLLLFTAGYQLHLAKQMVLLENRLNTVAKASEEARGEIAKTDKKVDDARSHSIDADKRVELATDLMLRRIVQATASSTAPSTSARLGAPHAFRPSPATAPIAVSNMPDAPTASGSPAALRNP